MPRGVKKQDLPSKLCERCGRPMVWRKAWAKNWDQVKFCSEKCKRGGTKREFALLAVACTKAEADTGDR